LMSRIFGQCCLEPPGARARRLRCHWRLGNSSSSTPRYF
jgi:hypothetical protein